MPGSKKTKKPHLGRGLESLLGPITSQSNNQNVVSDPKTAFPPDSQTQNSVHNIAIRDVDPNPYQPRTVWNEEDLADLAQSIRENGIIQPILLRPAKDGYEIIAGERRLRAAEIAGLSKVPALIRQATDAEMLELALVENIHRTDLNPLERALAYHEFITAFSLTQTEAAQRLGEDRSVVANYLRLLDLPNEIKQMLTDGTLSMGHARAILALPDNELRRKFANRAMAGRLSVREVERLVRTYLQKPDSIKQLPQKAPHIADLERRLADLLGTKVTINTRKKGNRGRIIIEFYSLDEFEKLTDHIGLTSTDNM